jgi:hypothetical protein
MHRERLDGSSPREPGITDREKETATSSSSNNQISSAPTVRKEIRPVPLYLIPQALSLELRQEGTNLLEVNIRRTSNHLYLISMVFAAKEDESHA